MSPGGVGIFYCIDAQSPVRAAPLVGNRTVIESPPSGYANAVVISVLERRGEIGLRRSLGATQGNIRSQFLTEAVLLSALGGIGGIILGIGVTAIYSATQGWPAVVPA